MDTGSNLWLNSEWNVDGYVITIITEYYITSLISVAILALTEPWSKNFGLFTVLVCQAAVIMIWANAYEVNVISIRACYCALAELGISVGHGALCVHIDLFYFDGLRAGLFQVDKGELALS